MRILLLTDAFPPEVRSASHLMYELAEDLCRRGHSVAVLTCAPRYNLAAPLPARPKGWISREKQNGVEVVRVAAPPIHNLSHWRRGLGQLLLPLSFYWAGRRLARPDAVLCYSPPLTLGLAAHWLARRWRAPFLLNVQDLFPQNAIDLGALRSPLLIASFERLEKFLYRRPQAIAVHSSGNASWLRNRGVPGEKIHVIPNWVDTRRHRPQDARNGNPVRARLGLGDRSVVLFAGVMGHAQDLATIVEAAAALATEPRVVFLLVGDGAQRPAVERRLRALALANVRLLPFVPWQDYPALVAACDVGLVTLKKEMKTPVVPSKLLTYMACGRPVILSLPGESDACAIVREADCGLLVRPGDAGALAAAIRTLLADPAHADRLGAAGRRYAVEHFQRSARVTEYEALLKGCLGAAIARH